jgi:hypothetical protein
VSPTQDLRFQNPPRGPQIGAEKSKDRAHKNQNSRYARATLKQFNNLVGRRNPGKITLEMGEIDSSQRCTTYLVISWFDFHHANEKKNPKKGDGHPGVNEINML